MNVNILRFSIYTTTLTLGFYSNYSNHDYTIILKTLRNVLVIKLLQQIYLHVWCEP